MKTHPALSVVAPAGDRIRSGKKILESRQWSPESVPLRYPVIVQKHKEPNQAVDPIPYSLRLPGTGHRRRSAKKYDSLFLDTTITH
jgi:hypothetical protein